jgi:hypothetical protein
MPAKYFCRICRCRVMWNTSWFESDYFYPVKLNPLKRLSGKVFDRLAIQIIRS